MKSLAEYPVAELKLIYRLLQQQIQQHTELMDSQLLEDLQQHLQLQAGQDGVDVSHHAQWSAWLNDGPLLKGL
jgi:hypothetical protein